MVIMHVAGSEDGRVGMKEGSNTERRLCAIGLRLGKGVREGYQVQGRDTSGVEHWENA